MSDNFPWAVVDVETTMDCPVGENKASPFWPNNRVVALGTRHGDVDKPYTQILLRDQRCTPMASPFGVIAHHADFDIHHCWKRDILKQSAAGTLQLWDTQVAAYLLTGQRKKFASLDDLAVAAGGTLKDSQVKQYFEAGLGADEIDPVKLTEYLAHDVENTWLVFKQQWDQVDRGNLFPLIWSQMDAKLACTEMMWNGMCVDLPFVEKTMQKMRKSLEATEAYLAGALKRAHPALKLHSAKDLGTYIFGGTVNETVKKENGVYKNGKTKYKSEVVQHAVVGIVNPDYAKIKRMKNGCWPVSEEVIDTYIAATGKTSTKYFLTVLKNHRALQKQYSTYFEAVNELVMPDGCIHQTLNQCLTATGRLSCSHPNLQNVTDIGKSDIKKAYVSRWGDKGHIIEVDYSQLEMIALAILSNDQQLKNDIRNGVDMHTELFRELFKRKPTKDERRTFKRCSFALVYGGGPKAISTQGGITLTQARDFIRHFYARYRGVAQWHAVMALQVKQLRYSSGMKDDDGTPVGEAMWHNPLTGRRLWFREYANEYDKDRAPSFSVTEVKNYPVQSFATGDIVPMMVGYLFRVLKNNAALSEKCLLVNTVHDSVILDCHDDVLNAALPFLKYHMERVPQVFESFFSHKLDMEFKVEVKYGPNWGETKEWVDPALMKEAA
jgi:DNA polymerase I-like protein with 3'-5' exonuclease and polymerase domains